MEFKKEELIRSLKHIAGQKFTWFAFSMVALTATAFSTRPDEQPAPVAEEPQVEVTTAELIQANNTEYLTVETDAALPEVDRIEAQLSEAPQPITLTSFFRRESGQQDNLMQAAAQQLVSYANSLMGTRYIYGGTSKKGFDCSGFVYHVFSKYDIDLLRSSRAQSTQGTSIAVEEVKKGDVLFFTGTNPKVRKVGHVGIVNSEPGEPVTFVHSSSNGGVKVSELEGYYTTRFMFAKRMLDEAK